MPASCSDCPPPPRKASGPLGAVGNLPIHSATTAVLTALWVTCTNPALGVQPPEPAVLFHTLSPGCQAGQAGCRLPGAPSCAACQTLGWRPSSSLRDGTRSSQPGVAALWEVPAWRHLQDGRAGQCTSSAARSPPAGGRVHTPQKRLHGPEKYGKRQPPSPFLSERPCLSFLNVQKSFMAKGALRGDGLDKSPDSRRQIYPKRGVSAVSF